MMSRALEAEEVAQVAHLTEASWEGKKKVKHNIAQEASNEKVKHAFAQEADCGEEPLEGDILKWVEEKFVVQHLFSF